ncbi:MAG: shikimate kinase [Elusimicrobia bacterium]|nr:shikimate kinase [Elusimicrobiota bacterium]
MSEKKISLIGFTGTGKTEAGGLLAGLLRVEFIDLDKAIEAKQSLSITEIFAKHGVESFRAAESEALSALLEQDKALVVSTGGGTLSRPANRTRLKNMTTAVWLKAKPETIWRRVQGKPYVAPLFFTRPDPLMAIQVELGRRRPHYEEVARLSVQIDGKTPGQVAQEIYEAIQ